MAISVLSSILLNIVIMRVFFPRAPVVIRTLSNSETAVLDPSNEPAIQPQLNSSVVVVADGDDDKVTATKEQEYNSRFVTGCNVLCTDLVMLFVVKYKLHFVR